MDITKNAIFMGSGQFAGNECYERICKLISLFSDLSGIQQMGLRGEEINEVEQDFIIEYLYEAKDFVKQLEKDLGLK